ncbi:MAG: methyltransferase domain-containing protein [Leucobacter sp.]
MAFTATVAGIVLPPLEADVQSIDIVFGDDRVWSIDLLAQPQAQRGRIHWPDPIIPYLVGSTQVSLKRSGDDRVIATTDAQFTDSDVITRIVDANGVPLALNKWGRLGKTLESGNVGVQERILDRTEEVIDHLIKMGLRPFVVGGTLLGGIRDHALLPHDDDADVAYLSAHTNPVDVAAEGFEVGNKLVALGYELVRHSATHMQLYFRTEKGELDHYVDVFTAFFTEDGCINQPFHVRGEMSEDQMLPFGTVYIQGRPFPAPADPEAWLVINYDENWRTPIPGYRLVTPRPTIRRFQSWFGSFHRDRDFWNEHYQTLGTAGDEPWLTGRRWIRANESELRASWLVDLGSGGGTLAAELRDRNPHRRVIAADYSPYAREVATTHADERFSAIHVNLYRNLALTMPTSSGIDGPFDLVANHLFDHLGEHAIPQAMRLARMALNSGGSVLTTVYGKPDLDHPHRPTSVGFAPSALSALASRYGILVEVVRLAPAKHEKHRAPYGARFTLEQPVLKETL